MLKSSMLVTVIVIVFMVGAPNILAQQTDKWYTYHKPQTFSIDYPVLNTPTNITEEHHVNPSYDLISITTSKSTYS